MDVYLIRQYFKTHTYGILVADGNVFHTLEHPDLDNARNISCFMPPGSYDTAYIPVSGSGKFRKVWHILDVPDRTGILIHNGNLLRHTQGCILLGTKRGKLAGEPAVLASRTAMRQLLDIVGEQGFRFHLL